MGEVKNIANNIITTSLISNMAPKKSKKTTVPTKTKKTRVTTVTTGGDKKKRSGLKHTTVKNIKGTSKDSNKINNLKEKYKKATGTNRKYCSVKGCKEGWADTAHVQKQSRNDKSWQVVPTCRRHNRTPAKMKVGT